MSPFLPWERISADFKESLGCKDEKEFYNTTLGLPWAASAESWSIRYAVVWGNPEHPDTWQELDAILTQGYATPEGLRLKVARTFVDSGFRAKTVYDYVSKAGQRRGVAACKGRAGSWPLVVNPSEKKARFPSPSQDSCVYGGGG